jgi:hypothetical protein
MKDLEKAYKKARQKAIRLSRHILRHLNTRNSALNVQEGGELSPTEIVLNIQVMGRLLDILASEHQPHEDQWSYTW